MDSLFKFKAEFDNLVSKIKLPGQEVSKNYSKIWKFAENYVNGLCMEIFHEFLLTH